MGASDTEEDPESGDHANDSETHKRDEQADVDSDLEVGSTELDGGEADDGEVDNGESDSENDEETTRRYWAVKLKMEGI